jgi:hypothetical protein
MRNWFALVLVVVGCGNAARDAALDRAKVARARGDIVGEALALADACRAAPDDKDLCAKAQQASKAAHEFAQQNARTACTDVSTPAAVDRCLDSVAQVRRMAPQDPEAARLAEVAGRRHAALCEADSPAWQTSFADMLQLVRCEEARAPQIALQSYAQEVENSRGLARDQLLALLGQKAFEGHAGAAAEILAAASCLVASPDIVDRARAARVAFVEKNRASIDLRATMTTPLPELCTGAAEALGGRAVCAAPRASAPQLTVIGDIAIEPVEHSAADSVESRDYVAGIIRFRNPDYDPAVRDEQFTHRSKEDAERDWRRDQSDCSSAESALSRASSCSSCPERTDRDRACGKSRSSEDMYRQRERDWDRARSHLSNTPQMKEREDIRTATYSVRTHHWRAVWRAQLRNDGKQLAIGGETSAEDRETAGAPVAGVPADPLTYPGNRWFVPAIREQAAVQLAQILDGALKRRASDLEVSCNGELVWSGDWLDCWARVRLWAGRPPVADALLGVVEGETDRKRAGTAWPALRCR